MVTISGIDKYTDFVLGGFFFARRMRMNGYATIIDPFQQRFGNMMGAVLYIPALLGDIFVVAAVLGALGIYMYGTCC